ncbi:MAG TPA: DUF3237 domain-containing protein [Candidatus Acidoferrum sp.]|jgi:hypothetical protein|nr:DUF3237 domain-containing protein [Candidatus Acidoferrum sp.]
MNTHNPIDRRSMLKGSVLGGAALAESLFSFLPDPALAAPQNAAPAAAPQAEAKSLGEIVPIKLEYVFQIRIDFSERVSFETPNGRRAYVPAVSGVIEGPRLQGIVVPHSGADYAGNGRLNAHYMLKASDGTMIYIHNEGYLYPLDGKPIDRNDPSWGGDREFYFRITPVFDTPVGLHDWLTRTVIVGTGKRHANPDYTIFTYYAVL